MKRSQMLGKIWEVLYKETDYEEEGLKLLSEQILDIIEENHMLPPTRFSGLDEVMYLESAIKTNTWEPEDD